MSPGIIPSVSVIITAHEAAATIGDAVRTALAEPETAQVIVVDDASSDGTAAAAERAADGDGRLLVIRRTVNGGPAAARNQALDQATGDIIAVLDSDDFILPGRFSRLLGMTGWDMVADNILFVAEDAGPATLPRLPEVADRGAIDITLSGFVQANHSTPGANRQEWGFLKPLIRREFLTRNGLRYNEALRLGEDYDLYVRMLQKTARFRVSTGVGYVARWRAASLSSRHRTADLAALHGAAAGHLSHPGMDAEVRAALGRHLAELRQRYLLRDMLDNRRRNGRARAILSALCHPSTLLPITRGVIADKRAARRPAPPSRIGQVLIDP